MEKAQWQKALTYMNQAIAERPQPKANTKTYGMRFIDYLPYLYRGIAYHRLGDDTRALQDLQKSEAFGEARKARRDKKAMSKLKDTLSRLKLKRRESQPDVQALLAEGVARFREADYRAARQKFNAVLKINPNHREAQRYIDELDRRLSKPRAAIGDKNETPQNEQGGAVRTDSRHLAEVSKTVEDRLEPKAEVDSPKPSGKRAEEVLEKNVPEGLRFFESGDFENAKKKFKQERKTGAEHAQVSEYLKIISEVEAQARDGIVAFFEGDLDRSISQLSQAARRYRSNPKLHAVLGCAYATKYLLSGDEDQASLRMALESFREAKKLDADYQLDPQYFSPRVIALFNKEASQ